MKRLEKFKKYILPAALVIVSLIIGFWIGRTPSNQQINTSEHQHIEESANQTWTCSMHPQIRMDKPGDCPICGMDLIPLKNSNVEIDDQALEMSESAMKLAEVQTSTVIKGTTSKEILLYGKIQVDERLQQSQTAHVPGRIEQLNINVTGELVKKGQLIASIYSPELVTAQKELIEALSLKDKYPSLIEAAREKLRNWKLSDEQINKLENSGNVISTFDIYSNTTGIVVNRKVNKGDYISKGAVLFDVTDLSKVWGVFDAYESDLAWISINQKVDFTAQAIPGKTFSGKISFIDPVIDASTRITRVRIEIMNPNLQFKPEMFINGLIHSGIKGSAEQIYIPQSAVLWTGKRSVVYVKMTDTEHATFKMREITLGASMKDSYIVVDGLMEGEEIVTNGTFSVDAAAQLAGKTSMMNPSGGAGSTPHDMSKMDLGSAKNSSSEVFTQSETLTKPKSLENIDPTFKKQLTKVFEKYLIMKDAFVASDAHKVMTAANDVTASLEKVDMALLKGEAHLSWMEYLGEMEKSTSSMSKLMDIEKQRVEFSNFNLTFYKSLKTFGLINDTAYYQYCPMANGDKGAYWFSDSEIIRNPYFGDAMLKCGENRETLK